MTSERVRLGIIGAGSFTSRMLVPSYPRAEGVDVVAVADLNRDAAERVAEAMGVAYVFTDPYELMGSGLVDAVHVVVPPAHLPELTAAAVDRGLHVISEKPIATSIDDARALADRAQHAGVVNAVDHEMRYDTVIGKIRELVAAGFVGEPRLVTINAVLSVGIAPESPLRMHTWYDDHALGGGFAQQVLSHVVDMARSVFGEFEPLADASSQMVAAKPNGSDPERLEACAADDVAVIVGRLPSGGTAVVSGSWVVGHGTGMAWDVRGSEGTLILDRDGTLRGGRNGQPLEPIADGSLVVSLATNPDWQQLIIDLAEDFAATVRGEQSDPVFATFADGVRVVETVSAVGARHATAAEEEGAIP